MIRIEEVIIIHEKLIDTFGGIKGIRDLGLLDSAINRPFMTFEQKDLYKTIFEKASALIHGLIQNHPFIDGNKRIGYFIFRAFLLHEGFDINADEDEKYNFVISIANDSCSYSDILKWLKKHAIES
ncbi:MAG: type II toxin-antitoxin system death-on-curing family toxin [Brevinematales bacterium]|jgi:death-on-curing protein